jgi:hypothetical protein
MTKSYYYSKNKTLLLFKSYFSSKFRSLKHDNYFYEDLFKKYKNKKIVFIKIGVAIGQPYLCRGVFLEKKRELLV